MCANELNVEGIYKTMNKIIFCACAVYKDVRISRSDGWEKPCERNTIIRIETWCVGAVPLRLDRLIFSRFYCFTVGIIMYLNIHNILPVFKCLECYRYQSDDLWNVLYIHVCVLRDLFHSL